MTATVRPPRPDETRARPSDAMPPFRLPAEHFAAALVWLGLGGAGLVIVAPDLARGAFLAPRVVAVTHCFTLGWITTSIFGALYQLFPVALGVPARSVAAGHGGFAVLVTGVAALVIGSWLWQPILLGTGWLAVLVAVGLHAWNVLAARRRATRGETLGRYVAAGHACLWFALAVVGGRIGAELGWWRAPRLGVLGAHAHLAAVGFATLTVVGVSSRLFPMFLLSRGYRDWPLHWIRWLVLGGLGAYTAGQLAGWRAASVAGGYGIAAGLGLYLVLAAGYFRTRTRRALDPGPAHAAAALVFLGMATLLGLTLLALGADPRLLGAYGVVGLVGWLSLLIVGMYYKIVPFLTWLHRYSPLVGQPGVPKVRDLMRPELEWGTLVLLVTGVALTSASVGMGQPDAARAGAAVVAAGVALVLGQYVRLALMGRGAA